MARKYVYESDFPLEEQALGPAGWGDEDVSVSLLQWPRGKKIKCVQVL